MFLAGLAVATLGLFAAQPTKTASEGAARSNTPAAQPAESRASNAADFFSAIAAELKAIDEAERASSAERAASGATCTQTMIVNRTLSLMDVTGELNGHRLKLKRRRNRGGVGPTGSVVVSLSGACPADEADLAAPFTFTMRTDAPLLVEPDSGFVVTASGVKVLVEGLQLAVRTNRPIRVVDTVFDREREALARRLRRVRAVLRASLTRASRPARAARSSADGLHVEIVNGTASALRKSLDLSSLSADFSLQGSFGLTDDQKLELFVMPSSAFFDVHLTEPAEIDGVVVFTNALTATAASAPVTVHATARSRRRLLSEWIDSRSPRPRG